MYSVAQQALCCCEFFLFSQVFVLILYSKPTSMQSRDMLSFSFSLGLLYAFTRLLRSTVYLLRFVPLNLETIFLSGTISQLLLSAYSHCSLWLDMLSFVVSFIFLHDGDLFLEQFFLERWLICRLWLSSMCVTLYQQWGYVKNKTIQDKCLSIATKSDFRYSFIYCCIFFFF